MYGCGIVTPGTGSAGGRTFTPFTCSTALIYLGSRFAVAQDPSSFKKATGCAVARPAYVVIVFTLMDEVRAEDIEQILNVGSTPHTRLCESEHVQRSSRV